MMAWTDGSLPVMVDALWRSSLVLLAGWAAAALCRRRSAGVRHAIWAAALAGAAIAPAASRILPQVPVPVLPAASMPAPQPSSDRPVEPAALADAGEPAATAVRQHAPVRRASAAAPAPAALPLAAPATPQPGQPLDPAGLVWLCVAAALLGRYAASVASVRRIVRRAEPVETSAWREAIEVAAARLRVTRVPVLLASDAIALPFTSGVVRPVVVVPATSLRRWDADRIAVVLLHEVAHVARRDCLVQALARAACAVLWFNPLAWLAARRLRAERERACDDLVLTAGTRGPEYARHLLEIARGAAAGRSLSAAALAMARPRELEGRLLAILDASRPRLSAHAPAWRLGLAAALLLAPIAAVQPVARAALTSVDAAGGAGRFAAMPFDSGDPAPTDAEASAPAQSDAPQVRTQVRREAKVVREQLVIDPDLAEDIADGVVEGLREGAALDVAALSGSGMAATIARSTLAGMQEGFAFAGLPAVQAAGEARAIPPGVVQGLSEALNDPDPDVRKSALHALVRLRSPLAFDTLVAALRDQDADIRQQAAFALGRLEDPRALDPLAAALKDGEADVRRQAAFGLAQLGDPKGVPALTAAVRDEDEDVREMALFALMRIGGAGSLPAFTDALKDPDADVRQQAAFALGQAGDRAAVPPLIAALSDADEDVRAQAAFALGNLGDERAIEPLTGALKDESAEVRRQAVFGLSRLAAGEPPAAPRMRPGRPRPAPQPAPAPQPPQ